MLAVLAAACARGPEPTVLAHDVQGRLDQLFGREVLAIRTLKRQGSASGDAGQAIVYYNATLEFAESYDPSDWEGLSPQLIATALGATDEGILGFKSGRIERGSQLRAYGSLVYRRTSDGWRAADLQLSGSQPHDAAGGSVRRTRASELVEQLGLMVDKASGLSSSDSDIIADELDRALQNISLRLDKGKSGIVIAAGPADGEYVRFIKSLYPQAKAGDRFNVAITDGSVANAMMIDSGKARFGLVQSDVAAAAIAGEDAFSNSGPLRRVRAVASLFPEPVHVIVRADSGFESLTQLAGRRIFVGTAGSGTRYTALQILAAHGLDSGRYVEVVTSGPGAALAKLKARELDAVVVVASAPWSQLAVMAVDVPLRLLALDPAVIEKIESTVHGLVPLVIPARTYAGQENDVRTVGATAILVANSDVPEAAVVGVLNFLFAEGAAGGRGVNAARLSRKRALVGITIPLHEGSARYFSGP